MTDLSNKDSLSYILPKYHYLSGVILILLTMIRIINRLKDKRPEYPDSVSGFESKLARCVQWLMLLAGLSLMLSGYALATADGSPALLPWGTWLIQVLPDDSFSLKSGLLVHEVSLYAFGVLLGLHILGFIKHQLSDRSFYKRIL